METTKNKSSILLSIFKRKGGEGIFTKIISDDNKIDFSNQIILLDLNEKALIIFKENELNWLAITNKRIVGEQNGIKISITFTEILRVNIAIQEEFKDKVTNKEYFNLLKVNDKKNNYILKIEKGAPFQGFYQVLHYIATNNQNSGI